MGAVMLIFALAGGGAETTAFAFPSMAACEAARGNAMQQLADLGAVYAAAVCVTPTKVQGV